MSRDRDKLDAGSAERLLLRLVDVFGVKNQSARTRIAWWAEHSGVPRGAKVGVQHDANRVLAGYVPNRERRIVRQHRAHAHEDGVRLISKTMRLGARGFASDPLGVSGPRGDLAVERDGGFECHVRKPSLDVFCEVRDERRALLLQETDLDLDSTALELVEPSGYVGRGVPATDDDPGDASRENRVGARAGSPMVVARLQRDIQRCGR